MFVNYVGINGFLEKQQLKSQKSAINAKVRIGILQEKVRKNDNKRTSTRGSQKISRKI